MSQNTTLTASADGIKAFAELVEKGHGLKTTSISVSSPGLPSSITIGYGPNGDPKDLRPLFEKWRTRPERKTGTARALTLTSFIDLVNRHKTEHSAVFADTDWQEPGFTAVIDYHPKETSDADNARHHIAYAFPLSDEWKAWVEKNGTPMAQGEFAAFLEDRIADLSSPTEGEANELSRTFSTTVATPSELISLSRGLAVNVEAKVKQAVTLQSGEMQVQFEEQHLDAAGKPIVVPGMFLLAIAPFFLGERIRIPVRLRYRVREGKLLWFYQIYRPDQFVTERIRDDLEDVRAGTELPCFEGTPES